MASITIPYAVADFIEMRERVFYYVDKILLCSDGLSNMIEDDEIRDIVSESDDLKTVGEKLVERANYYGGKDNISAVVAAIDWEE